jgi:hypothetical protein
VSKYLLELEELGSGGMDWIDLAEDMNPAGACECDNELSGSIKCGEFLDYLLRKDSAPWR